MSCTLHEAIEHARAVAKGCPAGTQNCAYQHDKLVDWLEELERLLGVLGETYDLDRLRELVEADKDGRCVVLPCHVGDQVYYVAKVVSAGYPDPVIKPEIFLRPFKIEWLYGIGKFVFMTREAAETALAKEDKNG